MNLTNRPLKLPLSSEQAVQWATRCIAMAGLRVLRSFDLQSTRALNEYCSCPYHGAEDCSCQMVVLLVYGQQPGEPATLIIHGHDDQSWLALARVSDSKASNGVNQRLAHVLEEQFMNEMMAGVHSS
ncbi:MAG: hypothetical protein GXP42_07185 [Chloroflexi bacterium]|nr:hypothetical protein [Chloroflexota bacterium]